MPAATIKRAFWTSGGPRRGSWGKGLIHLRCFRLGLGGRSRKKAFCVTAGETMPQQGPRAHASKQKAEHQVRETKGEPLGLPDTLGHRAGARRLSDKLDETARATGSSPAHMDDAPGPLTTAVSCPRPLSGSEGCRLHSALRVTPAIIASIQRDGVRLTASVT